MKKAIIAENLKGKFFAKKLQLEQEAMRELEN